MKEHKQFVPEEWGVTAFNQNIIRLVTELENERKRLNLTQVEVCEKAGLSQGQLSRIERLESVPSAESLSKIAAAVDKHLLLTLEPASDYCRWIIADDQYNHWRGDCGYEFVLEGELSPLAHGFFFCPSCGKHLTISEVHE